MGAARRVDRRGIPARSATTSPRASRGPPRSRPRRRAEARTALDDARAALDAALGDAVLVLPSAASVAPSTDADGAEIEAIRAATLRMTAVAGVDRPARRLRAVDSPRAVPDRRLLRRAPRQRPRPRRTRASGGAATPETPTETRMRRVDCPDSCQESHHRAPINPPARLLMGPGPINADPRVLRAMSAQLVGQFDPAMTGYMNETMELYRGVFRTATSRPSSSTAPPAPASRRRWCRCSSRATGCWCRSSAASGTCSPRSPSAAGAEVHTHRDASGARCSTPAADRGRRSSRCGRSCSPSCTATPPPPCASRSPTSARSAASTACCSTATPPPRSAATPFEIDAWGIDVATAGLQKCLGGPSGSAPISSPPRRSSSSSARKHVEAGIRGRRRRRRATHPIRSQLLRPRA